MHVSQALEEHLDCRQLILRRGLALLVLEVLTPQTRLKLELLAVARYGLGHVGIVLVLWLLGFVVWQFLGMKTITQ